MKPIIQVEALNYTVKDKLILKDVSFQLFENEIIGIIGPNGGGKTTLIKCIMGLLAPQSGAISIMSLPPKEGRKYIGYMPQVQPDENQFPITVLEVVLTSCLKKGIFYRTTPDDEQKARQLLNSLGIEALINDAFSNLSGGQKQRVLLARALMSDPKCLILDEPTCSIDSPSGFHFFELLKSYKSKMAILLVSHDLSAIAHSVDRIGCLNQTLALHHTGKLSKQDLDHAYCCDVDFIAHGLPHRVLDDHEH